MEKNGVQDTQMQLRNKKETEKKTYSSMQSYMHDTSTRNKEDDT